MLLSLIIWIKNCKIWNFRLSFEIRCLSNKKPIYVDSVTITSKDNPVILKHRSSIQIGKFILMFYLPKF